MSTDSSASEVAIGRAVAWLEQQLHEMRDQSEQIQQELSSLYSAVRAQQRDVVEIGAIGQRLDEESALRRDQGGAIVREQQRDREVAKGAVSSLQDSRTRIDALEQRLAGAGERSRRIDDELAEHGRVENRLAEQLVAAEGRIAALAEVWAKEREERVRFAAVLPELTVALDEIDARTLALRSELRRSEEGLAELRGRREREDALNELIEQQRAIRLRLEDRLRTFEAKLEETLQRIADGSEERLALSHQVSGAEARTQVLAEALEGQRWAVIEHFRRLIDAEEQHGREEIDEIEKRIRRGRSLLVRLSEGSQQAGEEQPL
jgi:chromosome segregation ATPase